MKIKTATFLGSASRSSRSRGMGSVEALICLVGAYFLFSTGFNWFEKSRSESWTETRLTQLAHEMVAMAETAQIAGVDLIRPGNVHGTIEQISRGAIADHGVYQGQFFGVPNLNDEARERVANYLEFKLDRLSVVKLQSFASSH
jgi:hypothetical protein